MPNTDCFVDVATFKAMAFGIPTPNMLGLNTRLAAPVAGGATLLTVTTSAGIINPGDSIFILDGPNSEILMSDPTTPAPQANQVKLLQPTQWAHGVGVSVSSPGRKQVALADILLRASWMVEDYCKQGTLTDRSLFQQTRTVTYELDTPWAYVDQYQSLVLRAAWFPVNSVSSATLQTIDGATIAVATANAVYDANLQRVTFPQAQPVVGQQQLAGWQLEGMPLERGMQGWLTVTFSSGFAANAVPSAVQEATVLFAQEILAWGQNPTGAAMIRRGDVTIQQQIRSIGKSGENSADGTYAKQAKERLDPWRNKFA
jgi:hypothetical protein